MNNPNLEQIKEFLLRLAQRPVVNELAQSPPKTLPSQIGDILT